MMHTPTTNLPGWSERCRHDRPESHVLQPFAYRYCVLLNSGESYSPCQEPDSCGDLERVVQCVNHEKHQGHNDRACQHGDAPAPAGVIVDAETICGDALTMICGNPTVAMSSKRAVIERMMEYSPIPSRPAAER